MELPSLTFITQIHIISNSNTRQFPGTFRSATESNCDLFCQQSRWGYLTGETYRQFLGELVGGVVVGISGLHLLMFPACGRRF